MHHQYQQLDKNNVVPQATRDGPEVHISCLSNVYVRRMHFKRAGIVELGHRHPYSHASLVASGSVSVQLYDDQEEKLIAPVIYKAPAMIMIAKELAHQITSLEDDTVVCCIHALRDEDQEIIDPEMLPVPTGLRDAIMKVRQEIKKELTPPYYPVDNLTSKRVPRIFDSSKHF